MQIPIKAFLILLFLMATSILISQNYTLPLWEGNPPNYRQSEEIEIRDTSDIVLISKVQKPTIEVFLPASRNATGDAVLIFPGGGYHVLAYDWEGSDIAKWLNSKGIAAIVVKYRLPVSKSNILPHKSPLLDAKRAVRLTRFHAEDWNIKPDRIGIIGFSAGGHLASTLGTHFDLGDSKSHDLIEQLSSRPDFMILGYPVISFTAEFIHLGSKQALLGATPDQAMSEFYSNELQVKKNTPPTFIFHSGDDQGVPVENSLAFYRALLKNNIPTEMHIFPKGGHGYSLAINQGTQKQWPELCIRWINEMKSPKINVK